MARFAYDVNTRTRLIDVHKQFNGGLKTVDTDDALGAVYLRQAENVSLSEFGFIEKRYGTFQKDILKSTGLNVNSKLQGYWEYMGFAIFVVNGVFYYKGTGDPVPIEKLFQESSDIFAPDTIYGKEWRYPTVFNNPTTFAQVTGCEYTAGQATISQTDQTTAINQRGTCGEGEDASTKSDYTICTAVTGTPPEGMSSPYYSCQVYSASDTTVDAKVYTPSFPTDKDMNAVNVNNVLYIFTGKYPVYVKIVQNVPRFYVFPITIPTYDEIVVTGHNLLEEDYDEIYFKNKSDIQYTDPGVSTKTYAQLTSDLDKPPFFVVQKDSNDVEIKQHAPQIAYQDGGELDFNFKYVINPTYLADYHETNQPRIFLLDVDSIGYRASGPGSTEYTLSDPDSIDFSRVHNYTGNDDLTFSLDSAVIDRQELNYDFEPLDTSTGAPDPNDVTGFTLTTELGYRCYGLFPRTNDTPIIGKFEFDLNTEKNGFDFVSEPNFLEGEVFEFQIRKQTTDASAPTSPIFIPESIQDAIDTYTSLTYSNLTSGQIDDIELIKSRAPKIRIVPTDEDGNEFENDKVVISGSDLVKTSTGYQFVVPAGLARTTTIAGYHISLRGEMFFEHQIGAASGFSNGTVIDANSTISKELVRIENLPNNSPNLSSKPNLSVKLKNLLSGTYDFKLRYKLTKYTRNSDNFLEFENAGDGVEYADVFFYNVPITAEKLQDFPGVTEDFLPKLKPIWSCNKVMEHYGKLMVWGSTEMPTALFYSFPDRPTYFPSKFYLDFTNNNNQPLEAVTPYMNILVAQTASQTWGIRGNSGLVDAPAPYVPFSINGTVGTIAYKSVRPVRNHLFFLSRQGVIALKSLYAADEQYNIDFVDRNIRNIVPQDSKAVGIQFDNQYWLNFPENSITLRWYIDKKAWVRDVYQGWVDKKFKGVFKYQIADGKLEFITHPSIELEDENVYKIHKIGVDYDLPTDLTEGIKSKFETSFLNQNYPFHPKNYKEAKLDFTLQNEYNKSQGFIYEMDYDEDLDSTTVHTLDNVTIIPNHYYRLKYNFEPHNPPVLDAGGFVDDYEDEINGGTFGSQESNTITGILENDDYDMSTFDHLEITDVSVRSYNDPNVLVPVNNLTINTDTGEATFQVPNVVSNNQIDIVVTGDFTNYTNGADITNITYDDALTLNAWVVSEDQTLNLDNINSYDQAKADVNFNFNTRLGTWVFGSSDFGNKVTAVKTIKLSGKGYNAKVYIEDNSKSKWTLESLGLTYKMKRARSR